MDKCGLTCFVALDKPLLHIPSSNDIIPIEMEIKHSY